jgi:hypothetical protein
MKEQQRLNLNGRKEIGKLEMTKEVVYTLNGMGLLAFFAFGFFFIVYKLYNFIATIQKLLVISILHYSGAMRHPFIRIISKQ